MFVNAIILEAFEISSWNFMGAKYRQKLRQVWKWLYYDALQHTGGDLTSPMFLLNIFLVLKLEFSLIYDVVFAVNVTAKVKRLTLNCVISSKLKKPFLLLLCTSLCSGCHDTLENLSSAGSLFLNNSRKSNGQWVKIKFWFCVPYHKLLTLGQIHCSNLKMKQRSGGFFKHYGKHYSSKLHLVTVTAVNVWQLHKVTVH